MTTWTSEFTTAPSATPMMTPTARGRAFVFVRDSLKPWIMAVLSARWGVRRGRTIGRAAFASPIVAVRFAA